LEDWLLINGPDSRTWRYDGPDSKGQLVGSVLARARELLLKWMRATFGPPVFGARGFVRINSNTVHAIGDHPARTYGSHYLHDITIEDGKLCVEVENVLSVSLQVLQKGNSTLFLINIYHFQPPHRPNPNLSTTALLV
jgi:hypothetical protein